MNPVAWIRKWEFDGEEPRKEKRENGRLAWPAKFKLLPVTTNKCADDDVPLYTADQLREVEQQRDELLAALIYAASCLDTDGNDPIIDAAIAKVKP